MNKLKAGWSERDITPEGKVELYGQYYQRVSTGIHSRLSVTALALESEDDSAIMVSADLTNAKNDFLQEVRQKVAEKCGEIDTQKILLNCTHTHSATAVCPGRNWWTPQEDTVSVEDYRALVGDRIVEAVIEAWQNRTPCGYAHGSGLMPVGHCRRAVYENGIAEMYGSTKREDFIGMEGNEDSVIEIAFLFNEEKEPTGAIVNVACPSQVMEATYKISSDYMGEVRRLLKNKFGENFRTLCQISAAGCQSPRDLIRTDDDTLWSETGVALIGKRVFDVVEQSFDYLKNEIRFDLPLAHKVQTFSLPKRKATYTAYRQALKDIEKLEKICPSEEAFKNFCAEVKANEKIPGRPGPYDSKLHHFVLIRNAEAVVKRYAEQQDAPNLEMEFHAVRIGDTVTVTNPFELFLDYGHRIKARSKAKQTFIAQLSCDSCVYLPTIAAERHGGYGGLIINGVVGSDGGKKLVDETVQAIDKLFS